MHITKLLVESPVGRVEGLWLCAHIQSYYGKVKDTTVK